MKVGDIDAPPQEQSYLLPETCFSDGTVVLPDGGGVPDNWPQIPHLSRRRSCEASGERTNCVNKAVEHLQLLQDIVTDWVQKTEGTETSATTDDDRKLSIHDFDPENNKDAVVPLPTDHAHIMSVEALKEYSSDDQLKVVVNEVMLLLAWLHDDCQRTEMKLQSEKDLVSKLSLTIDTMSQKKLNDLRIAVQKEHDRFQKKNKPCLIHLTYLNRIHASCKTKFKSVQNLNFHLKKDIAWRNKQIPMVQEKLLLENEHLNKVKNALDEAEYMMAETVKNKVDADVRCKEAQETIKKEQNLLDQQINAFFREYNKVFNAAEEAEKTYHAMTQGIINGEKQIKDNEKEQVILAVKLENSKTKFNILQVKNIEEKENLVMQLKETQQMKKVNKKIEDNIEDLKCEYNSRMLEIDEKRLKLEGEIESCTEINQVLSRKIETIEHRIEESKKQTEFYEKNLKRMIHDIQKTETQITLTIDELQRMKEVNAALSEAAEQEQMKTLAKEKSLQQTIHQIRKEIDLENKSFLDMTTQVQDLEFESRHIRAEARDEKERLLALLNNATSAQDKQTEKLDKLTNLQQEKIQELADLKMKQISIKENFEQILKDNEEYLARLRPYTKLSEHRNQELEVKINLLASDEARKKMEMEVMQQQGKALESSQVVIEEKILKWKGSLADANLRLDNLSKIAMDTRTRWEESIARLNEEKTDHKDLLRCRKETLVDISQKKKENLEENSKLALEFRTKQNDLREKKKEYIRLSEETLLLKQALKDLKQLLKMQVKTQYNLKSMYNYRGLYHSQQLSFFVNSSVGSQNKIKQLKCEMDSKMEKMVSHLDEISSTIYRKKADFLPKINATTS